MSRRCRDRRPTEADRPSADPTQICALEGAPTLCDDGRKVVAFYSRALSAPRSRASRGAVALALLAGSAGLALVGYRALVYDHHQAAAESAVQILIASTFVGA